MNKKPLKRQIYIEWEALEGAQVPKNWRDLYEPHRRNKGPSDIIIDNIFAFQVAMDIMRNDEYQELQTVNECRKMNDWPKWKEAIQTELNSLTKREVCWPIVQTPGNIKPIGYKWVFVKKRNENDEIIRYKTRLIAQGFSQRPGIEYEETYSPVMDAITLRTW